MGIDSVSSSSAKPVVPQAPVEAPKPVTPVAEATPAAQPQKTSGFDTPAPKPVSITGKYAAPPSDASAVKDDLKADVSAQRMAGVAPPKPLNPNAVPLDYVEKGGAVVQKGQSGESVKQLQQAMNREGAKLPEDGKFDAKLETAVRDFQKKNGLPADGRVGQDTLKKLLPDADAVKKDPALSKLDPATQKQMRGMLDAGPKDRALAGDLQKMARSDTFQKLDKDQQALALSQLEKHAGDPAARAVLRDVATTPGFGKMDKHEQSVMLTEAGGTNDKISKSFREELGKKLTSLPADADKQKAELSTFLKDQNWTEWHTKDGAWAGRTQKADSVTGPTTVADGPFRLSKGPADKYDVKIGKETIPMFVPQGTPKAEVDKLVETMEALPEPNRQLIKQMVLEKNNNTKDPRPFDALDGRVTAYPEKSGMSVDQQRSAMIHESAHLIDAQMGKKDPSWDANWHKAMESDIAKSSQYGKKSDGEDFAEAYLTYKMTENNPKEHAEMRAMFPERFKLIDEIEKKAKAGTLVD